MTLGAATFVWRGNDQDYCFKETLACLMDLADQVIIAAGGPDGTYEDVEKLIIDNHWQKVMLIRITQEMWDAEKGREKLSYFSNMAISRLTTDYVFYLQCDEILSEESFYFIRAAIETGHEAFFSRRLNLWKDPNHMLNVIQDRKPCSTEVIRLSKTKYRCVDDAESIGAHEVFVMGNIDNIVIYHLGFIRQAEKHLVKIRHMLTEVFLFGENDQRAENCDRFIPERFFSEDDITVIPKPIPKWAKKWCQERYPDIEL